MFYNIDLLCRKRQGKFATIWFAATRGIKHVPRNDVQRVDIVHICEQLLEYIMSNSQSPNKRLSLYLSAKLIHGAVLIYKEQYLHLQQQICTFMCIIRRPPVTLFNLEDDQDEAKEKKKIQRKKKQRAIEPPEPELVQQVMQTVLQLNENMTDPVHITLREEVASTSQQPVQEGFGDEGQLDLQLALFTDEAWTTALLEHPAPPVPEIGEDRVEKRTAQSPVLTGRSPSKRKRLDDGAAQAHTFAQVNIVQHGSVSPDITLAETLRQGDEPMEVDLEQGAISPDLRMSRRLVGQAATQSANVPRQPAEPVPETAGADTAITTVQEPREAAMPPAPEELITPAPPPPARRRVIRTPRPRQPRQIDNNIDSPSRRLRGNINRAFENDIFTLGNRNMLENRRGTASSTPTRHQDPRDILKELLANVRLDNDTDYVSLVLKGNAGMTMDSVPAVEITGVTDQHNKTYLVPAAEQADVNAPIAALPQHGHELLVPEVQPAPTEHISRIEQQEEVPQIDVSAEYRQTFGPQRPREHTSTLPLPFDTESKRHAMLLTTIRNRFRENNNAPLKIEQLCVPLNRYKMATTFCALLSLEAKQYIVMQSAPDSVELDTITPGPRLWDL